MVSSSLLVGLTTVAGLVYGFPLRSADDLMHGSSNLLMSRSPEPRFKDPCDVADFLRKVDMKIPDDQDIQNWIDQVKQKGAMGGDDDGDSDNDDDDDDIDDNIDDDDDDDNRKQDHSRIEKVTESAVSETFHAVASSTPGPSSNVEGQITTVYVPVPVLPSSDGDKTLASTPTVFPSPSTTPMLATHP
ncbi:hypothetical protein PISL3812_02246 [Talaromyces islandicus]|uniref:Uncharacterized protein n=1 Tax=Talaromyces islandicus TaxID=28573 RepID=A0A0U1LPC8_TALIS|nr:hypothetical protein PISL3812_02246 [Talaromyces islandicus]